ncbi:ChbG/HpnK family deacetylase [Endozoicomonas sp. Mp262]|uniref:ChbG/HpnK family deacetylase n=1 Tax=Endozoicomonas sp. Mp262 TaxID=2919499 RepID=UPI0021E0E8F3
MKRISLCADDYAITPEVSRAILALAEKGRLQATSCMVTSDHWSNDADRLEEQFDAIDIGLHLNFTEGAGLTSAYKAGFPGLYKMLVMSHLRLLKQSDLRDEIHGQLDRFIQATGRQPDFIDGHQHVHHLPQVRAALLEVIQDKLKPSTWVRSVTPLISSNDLKSKVIEHSGAYPLRKQLVKHRHPTNRAFAGVYSLSPEDNYRLLMQKWLNKLPDSSLIMCHPGAFNDSQNHLPDHAEARQLEYDYLLSQAFQADCQAARIQLGRPSEWLIADS